MTRWLTIPDLAIELRLPYKRLQRDAKRNEYKSCAGYPMKELNGTRYAIVDDQQSGAA